MSKKLLTKEYLDDILVRLAHHSSALEGNTISLADTVTIILYDTVPGGVQKRELYEIDNHKEAFSYVVNSIDNNEKLDLNKVRDIHELLMNKLLHNRGSFKTDPNEILGANFSTASVQETPILMRQWVDNLDWQLNNAQNDEEVLKIVGDFHIQFERIHPFSDGNGRTGRLLMNYSLMEKGLPPLVIEAKDKGQYVNILANQDIQGFVKFAKPILEKEEERYKGFINKEKHQLLPEKEDSVENKKLKRLQYLKNKELER